MNHVESVASLRDAIRSNIDLAKPVSLDAQKELHDVMSNSARRVLDKMIRSESYPSAEVLVTYLPPGTVPFEWALHFAPVMDPGCT